MSRIKFVDKNAKVQPSPGSTGFRKSAEPQPYDAGAVAWRKTVEARDATIVQLQRERDGLRQGLRQALSVNHDALAAAQAGIDQRDTLLVGARAEIYKLEETMRYLNAEIDRLKADYDKRVFSEFPDFGAAMAETETDKSNKSNVDDDKSIGLKADDDKSNASPNGRQRYPKGQEPWTLEGIKKNTWYARQAKMKQKNA